MFHFAYPIVLYVLFPVLAGLIIYRLFVYKSAIYVYSLVDSISSIHEISFHKIYKYFLFFLRVLIFIVLILLIARPQIVDQNSSINVDGIDIILNMDVSGSMEAFDDLKDRRTRIEVSKKEATNFIKKRNNDSIGIVLFGKDVVSRCPLTLDKRILFNIIDEIKVGIIDPNGTALATSIACAVNRLKKSQSKSKILILLTDGVPIYDEMSPETAIELAKKYGVKIYTIAIGRAGGGFINNGFGGVVVAHDVIDMALLKKIASETGGEAYHAANAKELNAIYSKIDELEKTKIETEIFNNYFEANATLFWVLAVLILIEILLRFFIFRGLL